MLRNLVWTALELMYFLRKGRIWMDRAMYFAPSPSGFSLTEAKGKSIIFFSAHLGNWELLGAWLVAQGFPLMVIEKPQGAVWVRKVLEKLRARSGLEWMSKDEVDFRALLRALKNGKSVGLISDQNAGYRGISVEFFGRRTSTFTGSAHLHKATSCPVVPIFAFRESPGRLRVEVFPPLKYDWSQSNGEQALEENLRWHNQALEKAITMHPEQWLWLHRRWRDDE